MPTSLKDRCSWAGAAATESGDGAGLTMDGAIGGAAEAAAGASSAAGAGAEAGTVVVTSFPPIWVGTVANAAMAGEDAGGPTAGACTTGVAPAERTDDFVTGSPDDGAPAGGCG